MHYELPPIWETSCPETVICLQPGYSCKQPNGIKQQFATRKQTKINHPTYSTQRQPHALAEGNFFLVRRNLIQFTEFTARHLPDLQLRGKRSFIHFISSRNLVPFIILAQYLQWGQCFPDMQIYRVCNPLIKEEMDEPE